MCVDNIYNTRTIGIIKELRTVSNIHGIKEKADKGVTTVSGHHDSGNSTIGNSDYQDHGTRIARVAVMANVQSKNERQQDRPDARHTSMHQESQGI